MFYQLLQYWTILAQQMKTEDPDQPMDEEDTNDGDEENISDVPLNLVATTLSDEAHWDLPSREHHNTSRTTERSNCCVCCIDDDPVIIQRWKWIIIIKIFMKGAKS